MKGRTHFDRSLDMELHTDSHVSQRYSQVQECTQMGFMETLLLFLAGKFIITESVMGQCR